MKNITHLERSAYDTIIEPVPCYHCAVGVPVSPGPSPLVSCWSSSPDLYDNRPLLFFMILAPIHTPLKY